jgi:Ca-activated chloride channel family protein
MMPSAARGRALSKLVRWAFFAALMAVVPAAPASPSPGSPGSPGAAAPPAAAQTFRSGVNLVILPVTVTNTDGRFVAALTQRDFSVFEDDHQRPIEQFSAERVPVSLGILIDISGSMLGARFADARIALGKLLERLQSNDRVFLAVFNDTFRMVLPWTSDHGAVTDALARVVPRGGTSLYSALTTALPVLNTGSNQKKALVLISDGADNSMPGGIVNRAGLESAVQHALESDALIYAVGIGKPMPPIDEFLRQDAAARLQMAYDPPVDLDLLKQLTDPTGGYSQLVASSANLSSTVIQIADDLSAQYVIGFESTQPLDGKSHALKVTVANPGLRVRSRSEYVAAPSK